MTGVVLSGGENSRIPFIKGFLTVDGKTIIERALYALSKVLGRVVISTNEPERYFPFGVPLIGDIIPEKGPISGILSVLTATGEDAIFVVACDMPFVNEDLVRYIAGVYDKQRRDVSEAVDAVIPVFEGKVEPLFGVYTRSVVEAIETTILTGRKGLIALLDSLNVRYITDEEVRAIDPSGMSFVNINTMEDYERIGGKSCLV